MENIKNVHKEKFKVLILLAYFNGGRYFEEQIKSILCQKDVQVDVLISDDCSDDFSKNVLHEYHNRENIKIFSAKHPSGSAGQNFMRLIRDSNYKDYDFVAFSDQDDIWSHYKIINAIKLISAKNADAYSCSVTAFWKDGSKKLITQSPKISQIDFLLEGAGQGCTFVMKKKLFGTVQRFCNKNIKLTNDFYYHDWLVYIIARSMNFQWFFDNESNLLYRQHGKNDTGAKASISGIIHRIKLIENGWYKNQIRLAIDIAEKVSLERNKQFLYFKNIFHQKNSLKRRIKLSLFFLRNSRRKISDKIVLILSALFDWL